MISNLIYKGIRHLGDVNHSRNTGFKLHKSSELGNACNLALINFSYIRLHKLKYTLPYFLACASL